MGGGEVARNLKKYGSGKIAKVMLVSTVLPFLLKTDDNPEGVPGDVFEKMADQMKNDRAGFLDVFYKQFFGVGLISHPVSEGFLEHNREISAFSSARAQQECATAFATTDFRQDLSAITVPTFVIHGDKDKTVPIDASSARTAKLIAGARYKVHEGAPHGLFYTHRDQLNADIAAFI
jgi:pimeloyl-ACP methyl ester carboxylesterase